MSTVYTRREAVKEARTGLRLHQESINCVLSIARRRQHQMMLSAQDERHLADNLDVIHELIIGLNTGHFLGDPFGQQPLQYVARLHGMAV